MAALSENFRGAVRGFNRTDVVQFIQRQTMEHEKELRVLREENARLQEALNAARAEAEAGRTWRETAEAARASEQEAREKVETAEKKPAAPDFNEQELAAYRRAEQTERAARERAAAAAERMRSIFAQTDDRLTMTASELEMLLSAFRSDFDRLQVLLKSAQGIVDLSSTDLKAASEICGEL